MESEDDISSFEREIEIIKLEFDDSSKNLV